MIDAICKDILKTIQKGFFFFCVDIVGIKKNSFTNCKSNLFAEYKETVNHLFFSYVIARVIWFALVCGIRMNLFISHSEDLVIGIGVC